MKNAGRKKLDPRAYAVAKRIQERRITLGLSIKEIAYQMGMKEPRCRAWESQFGESSERKHLNALATVLKTHPRWLSHGESNVSQLNEIQSESVKFDKVASTIEREALGRRLKQRRKELNLPVQFILDSIGINIGRYRAWEVCIPAYDNEKVERKLEALLLTPSGWLRNLEIETPQNTKTQLSTISEVDQTKTISEEIRLISCWLAKASLIRRTITYEKLTTQEKRTADVFAARYGVRGEAESILQIIGNGYGITRERVRQITEKMAQRATDINMPTPCLDKISVDIKQYLPCTIQALDERYRDLLGENLSVLSMDRFSREILGRKILNFTEKPAEMATSWNLVAYDPDTHDPDSVRAIRDASMKMIRACGAAQMNYVIGEASKTLNKGLTINDAMKAIRIISGFDWILEEEGWYWFGHDVPAENKLHTVTKKILSVSKRKLDVEDIAQALMRTRREYYEPSKTKLPEIEPTFAVIVEVLKKTPWLKVIQSDDFILNIPLEINDTLSDSELKLYHYLSQNGGVASRHSISELFIKTQGMNPMTLNFTLDNSPIINRLDTGVFALRGWPMSVNALKNALETVGGSKNNSCVVNFDEDGWIKYSFSLTLYNQRIRIFDIPKSIANHLKLGSYEMDGFYEPVILAKYNNGSHRLNQFVQKLIKLGYKTGDKLVAKIHPQYLKIKVLREN